MESFNNIIDIIIQYWPIVGVVALEILLRLIPSDKFRSILWYIAEVLNRLARLFEAISNSLSSLVPDRPAPPKE